MQKKHETIYVSFCMQISEISIGILYYLKTFYQIKFSAKAEMLG